MSFINVGARDRATNAAVPTKAALKRALSQDSESVVFYSTSDMGAQHQGTVASLAPTDTLSVCGPNPYSNRRWYASVTRSADGKIKVS